VRTTKEEKAKTHERIVEIAAQRIREEGFDRPGVAEIMQAAGMTHGGFYKHFGSRDDLIAEATEKAVANSDQFVHELTDNAPEPLAAFVDWYLSAEHRDGPGTGCAVAGLADGARHGDERVRTSYAQQVERYVENVEGFLGGGKDARERALLIVSAMVGALVLSRAVEEPLSSKLLDSAREQLRTP
jgi:TetR/AcrR family transcriptional regulator, transcriptional repressor for nem operon